MTSFKTKKISKMETRLGVAEQSKHQRIASISEENTNFIRKPVKKKRNPLRIIVGFLLIISSILFFTILGARALGNVNLSNKIAEIDAFKPIISLVDDSTQQEIVSEEHGVKNILIAGIGGLWHPGGELTDSLMLASLDYDKKTVTLLSIPRDLYVAYSSNTAGKINALYPMGQKQGEGINLLAKKVSEITGQPIHHYLVIDFSGFKSIVNALGGVEVDVPKKIYDREYPNNNWGWEVFSLEKWLQTLDGETALKFARSRHSTSDFDRSHRQQLLVQAIKDKALSLGVITNPNKIAELVESVRNNLSTDLTVGNLFDIGMHFKDMSNNDIITYSYNDSCSGAICMPGSYLYVPVRDNFGGEWVLLPNSATKSRLSRYDAMRQYAGLIFNFPHLKDEVVGIHIVTNSKNISQARNIRQNLQQLGFPINYSEIIIQTGATIPNSSIHAHYDSTTGSGFSDEHTLIKALKQIEWNIPFASSAENLYSKNSEPVIEIILGNDAKNYFKFNNSAPPAPAAIKPKTTTTSNTGSTSTKLPSENTQSLPSESSATPITLPSDNKNN